MLQEPPPGWGRRAYGGLGQLMALLRKRSEFLPMLGGTHLLLSSGLQKNTSSPF